MDELLFHPLLFSPIKRSMVSHSVKIPVQDTKVIENKLAPFLPLILTIIRKILRDINFQYVLHVNFQGHIPPPHQWNEGRC